MRLGLSWLGNNRQIIAFSISILVIFLLLSILSMLLYCYWRKRQAVHTSRLCQLLKQERFRHPQVLLLKRRRAYEQTIEYMQAKLDLEPGSPKILEQLKAALEGLHFINKYLALFPSDAVLDDDDHQDRLLRDPAPLPESASSSTQTGTPICSLTVLLNSVLQRMFGPPEQEDLAEEMRLLSSYNDWPPTTPGIESFAQGVRSQMQKNKFRAQQSLCIWETLFNQSNTKYSNAAPDQISTGEYRNPLYNQGHTLDPIPTSKRIVTFSPVDEVFEGSDQHSSCAFDDASAISEHSATELVTHSTALVCDEILAEDMRSDN